MFDHQFHPTPQSIIQRMVKPFLGSGSYNSDRKRYCRLTCEPPYMEPHGGNGAILDYLQDELAVPKGWLHTCELDPDLRYILQGKKYKVVGTDFLEYDEPLKFGLVIMNPPFADGVSHIWQGYKILADGGHLVSLLNVESLKNPCFKERQNLLALLAQQIGQHYDYVQSDLFALLRDLEAAGSIEFLGDCFRESDQATPVEVVLIRLSKPKKAPTFSFDSSQFKLDEETIAAAYAANPLALKDPIADLVARYTSARRLVVKRWEAQSELDFYLNGVNDPVYDADRQGTPPEPFKQEMALEGQLAELKSRFWNTIFTKTNLGRRAPSDFRKKFFAFTESQRHLSFTAENVQEVLAMFFLNSGKIMQDCTVFVFDRATAFHEKNIIHHEGWKTNKAYRVNHRIIMPDGVFYQEYRYSGYVSQSFSVRDQIEDFLDDMDKVLTWLAGGTVSLHGGTRMAMRAFCDGGWKKGEKGHQEPFESDHFIIRIYKKGTVHLDFKDRDLLAKFNQVAAQGKKWLGGGY